MSIVWRIRLGAVICLAVAGLLVAFAGSLMAMRGTQMPAGLNEVAAAVTSVTVWVRWLSIAALAWGVTRARGDAA